MPSPLSKQRRWAGRILSAAAVLFLLFDATIKLMVIPPVVEAFTRLGFPVGLARGIGTLELACLLAALVGELIGSPAARPAVRGPLTPTVIHRV